MKQISKTIICLILSLFILIFSTVPGKATEIDDSTVFVEAFNAYQQKDYLLAIEKCDQLNQVFPDSPLRDVTLLLIARASLKSGDNERAAKSTTMFLTEFPESSLKTSVEDELKVMSGRHLKGEILAADRPLQLAAGKIRSDALARERAAKLKLELERAAKAKAEQERLARIKIEEERREKERLLAEKLARASIKASISFNQEALVAVGGNGKIPVEISNKGKNSEEFLLTVSAAKEYDAILVKSEQSDVPITRLQLAAGETFKGTIALRMPAEMVDGHRSAMTIKLVSGKFDDISFQKEMLVISSAPLVRAVAKLVKQKVTQGEALRYRVTVLNVGSLPAQNLTVRLQLPPQIDFQGAPEMSLYKQEPNGTLVFKVDQIEMGKLAEIYFDVKVREDSAIGQELRGQVEIVNGGLQRKDIFTASASVVQAK